MSKLIIVCGLPGSGKTTVAKTLSEKIKTSCLHKDTIKENLYELLDLESLSESKHIGFVSIKLLYKIAEDQLAAGIDLIIEAPFNYPQDYQLFKDWQKKYQLDIYSVICSVDPAIRRQRFRDRPRHPAHHDQERDFDPRLDNTVYKKIPGKIINIKTNKPIDQTIKFLVSKIK